MGCGESWWEGVGRGACGAERSCVLGSWIVALEWWSLVAPNQEYAQWMAGLSLVCGAVTSDVCRYCIQVVRRASERAVQGIDGSTTTGSTKEGVGPSAISVLIRHAHILSIAY